MVNTFLAHDLLWGMNPQQLPADAPAWVIESIIAGQPVVVRRALSAVGQVAVGVRGPLREQRFAAVMEVAAVTRRVRPEELRHVQGQRDLPALPLTPQFQPQSSRCARSCAKARSAGKSRWP